MKADPAQQAALLELQLLDTKADQIQHSVNSLPQHKLLEAIDDALPRQQAQLTALEAEVAASKKAAERIDVDVEQVRSRVSRDEAALVSGALGAKELEAIQHELVSLARRQNELEEEELVVLQQIEDLETQMKGVQNEIDSLRSQQTAHLKARDEAMAELRVVAEDVQSQRVGVVAGIDADLVTLYEKVRREHGGIGAAALRGGSCEGCQLQITPSERARIQALPADELPRCEECGRLLIRV